MKIKSAPSKQDITTQFYFHTFGSTCPNIDMATAEILYCCPGRVEMNDTLFVLLKASKQWHLKITLLFLSRSDALVIPADSNVKYQTFLNPWATKFHLRCIVKADDAYSIPHPIKKNLNISL